MKMNLKQRPLLWLEMFGTHERRLKEYYSSTLSISSSKATCESVLNGFSATTKVVGTQYLEKKNGNS